MIRCTLRYKYAIKILHGCLRHNYFSGGSQAIIMNDEFLAKVGSIVALPCPDHPHLAQPLLTSPNLSLPLSRPLTVPKAMRRTRRPSPALGS